MNMGTQWGKPWMQSWDCGIEQNHLFYYFLLLFIYLSIIEKKRIECDECMFWSTAQNLWLAVKRNLKSRQRSLDLLSHHLTLLGIGNRAMKPLRLSLGAEWGSTVPTGDTLPPVFAAVEQKTWLSEVNSTAHKFLCAISTSGSFL